MAYRLAYDPDRAFLMIETKGFWTMDIFRSFEAELRPLLSRVRADHDRYRVLSDSLALEIQSKDVSSAFDRLMNDGLLAADEGPIAIVTDGVLKKMQAERGMRHLNVRFFTTVDDAMNWLFEAP
ncbi:hypothetical protein ASE00_09590 [Sphingomonas sp. Root710]|uniref:STAS/SEC14 domain-containing protein n=1 Tax=Sphingomonas sp. Root710 TaxID=1736594 RepID=UPI0006FF51BD|nr:STAS/SEC14 domain-containing protein [Sphingomonas sp. Root710]KRB82324.1 hypothetical protein ASE00_09590 [Sphingomonas sp. Root710]